MNRTNISLVIAASCIFGFSATMCLSQTVQYAVTVLNGSGTQIYSNTFTSGATVPLATTARTVRIYGINNMGNFDPTKSIGNLTFTGGPASGQSLKVVVGVSFNTSDTSGTVAAYDCAGIDMRGLDADVAFNGRISHNLTSYIDGIKSMYRVDVDGEIAQFGSIHAETAGPTNAAVVEAGSMASGSSVSLDHGTLVRVRTTGDMAGNVYISSGTGSGISTVTVGGDFTGSVSVPTGTLGSMTVTGNITLPVTGTPRIYARNGITSISAASITGVINTLYDGSSNAGNGTLTSLSTAGGSFQGPLVTQGFANASGSNPSLNINGDLGGASPGKIFMRDGAIANKPLFIRGSFLSGSVLSFGGSMPANFTIGGNSGHTTGQELQGQILMNARYFVGGTWTGQVRVGGSSGTLLNPSSGYDYTNTAASLGGGAIGVAPYDLHNSACDPPQLAALPPTMIDPTSPPSDTRIFLSSQLAHTSGVSARSIALEWYGPVFSVPGLTPVAIYHADSAGTPDSADWSDSFVFDNTVRSTSSTLGEDFNRRIVLYSNPQLIAGRYVVLPRLDSGSARTSPLCNGVNYSSAIPVSDFRYDFYVAPDCDADGIDDAYQISQDPLLDLYNSNDDIAPDGILDSCQCGSFADYNEDGNQDQGDVDYLINIIAGGDNPSGHNPDFNHDGNADQADIDALVNTIAGAVCPSAAPNGRYRKARAYLN